VFTAVLTCSFACSRAVQLLDISHSLHGLRDALTGVGLQEQMGFFDHIPFSSSLGYEPDLSALIEMSGDIELNPGPVTKANLDALRREMREDMKQCMAEAMQELRNDVQAIARKLDKFETAMIELKQRVTALEDETSDINLAYEGWETRLQDLHDKIEDQERRSRRDNILLYNVPENDGESPEDSEQKFLDVVNDVLPGHLTDNDIIRAHRVGQKKRDRVRPLIATLTRSAKKIAILQARASFKTKQLGVSGDLTQLQRDMVSQANNSGMVGYFRGNKFYTRPKSTEAGSPDHQSRHRSSQPSTPR